MLNNNTSVIMHILTDKKILHSVLIFCHLTNVQLWLHENQDRFTLKMNRIERILSYFYISKEQREIFLLKLYIKRVHRKYSEYLFTL